ncbi:NUDIX hydrolase [Kribbella solani]|uniref:8-oxo-dGTP pyrophosphatase MutT (NUDIX family) n=1 Tax=Kribbella solani TaxID=236067 RepID=A0A841DL03_9ACTN|nr:NUDIX domain-containing protein [Kribbella solani]MBB5977107.1 8-oxo-dGTP pyrophosphatase MutT (NUDIX family) [Kribbella solani]
MDRFRVVPAAYVLVRRGNEVLLLLRANTGYMDGHWAMPAGHVEQGESAIAAAVRELREEVGLEVQPADLVPLTAMHRTGGNGEPIDERVDFFFEVSTWSGEPRLMEPEKAAGLEWYALDALPEPLVSQEAQVLEALAKGEALPAVIVQGF